MWVPEAGRLGLRYVAHVTQANAHRDIITTNLHLSVELPLELQLFTYSEDACHWLREQHDHFLN